jgi:hypothetical protein
MTVVVHPVQVRLVPLPDELKFRRPSRLGLTHPANEGGKGGQSSAADFGTSIEVRTSGRFACSSTWS